MQSSATEAKFGSFSCCHWLQDLTVKKQNYAKTCRILQFSFRWKCWICGRIRTYETKSIFWYPYYIWIFFKFLATQRLKNTDLVCISGHIILNSVFASDIAIFGVGIPEEILWSRIRYFWPNSIVTKFGIYRIWWGEKLLRFPHNFALFKMKIHEFLQKSSLFNSFYRFLKQILSTMHSLRRFSSNKNL
jgi:hypothetical protein